MNKKVQILSPEQNIVNTLKGKKVLFLENGGSLDNGVECFEEILKRNKIKHTVLLDLQTFPLEKIIKNINDHDCIVFMTQWVYEIANKLSEYMFALKEKKIVVEVYISEPTWYYKPKAVHDVYIYHATVLRFGNGEKEREKFYKLSKKAYWDYKNNFDK